MAKHRHGRSSRYSAYTGGPDPLAPPVDLREALEQIGQDVMEGSSPRRALSELLRRGTKNMRGADRLAAEANRRRRELLQRNNLDGTLQEIKKLLDEAVLAERKELARALDDDARFGEMQIESLPPSPAKAVQELSDYDWRSQEAREKYEQIKDLLGREMLDQRFAGMKQALENATDEDRQRVNEMLDDLNDLLDKHSRGEDTQQDFDDFMDKHGEFFPENPQQRRRAARLAGQAGRRRAAVPQQPVGRPARRAGCVGAAGFRLAVADAGAEPARRAPAGGPAGRGLDGLVDGSPATTRWAWARARRRWPTSPSSSSWPSSCRRAMPAPRWTTSTSTRWPANSATRRPSTPRRWPNWSGRWSTRASWTAAPTGSGGCRRRRCASWARRRYAMWRNSFRAATASGTPGVPGAAGELTGATRPWQFGDTEPWNVTRTLTNAVLRQAGTGGRPSRPLRITVDDVEVSETETRTQAAVALLVDTSFSMVMENRWLPMKRTALALNHLVSTRFRSDALQIIAFGRYARTVTAAELTGLEGVYEQGTNLHHALALAGRHLRRHPNAQPVVLVVTDGEPTAHLEDFGDGDGTCGVLRLPAASADHRPHRARASTTWPGSARR